MSEIDLRLVGDTIVLHLQKQQHSINAYTLATTLVALADAAKEANAQINPGYEIEVVVETLSDGSFKAKVRAVYKSAGNIFSTQTLRTIVLAVIANYVYECTLAPDKSITVNVNPSEVIIEQDEKRIIVPRDVYEAEQQVKSSLRFREKIGQAFDSALKDPDIESISIDPDESKDKELPPISRKNIELIALPPEQDDDQQVVNEIADLQIIRAILEKSKRRWEFSWKGFRFSAPIIHDQFYADFKSHRITIAPGDTLRVRLRIYQRREQGGVMINDRYEVMEVLEYKSAPKQIQGEF